MKKSLSYLLPIYGLLALACTREPGGEPLPTIPVETPAPDAGESACTPGVAIVELDDALTALVEDALAAGGLETKSSDLDNVLADLGVSSLERVFP